MSESDEEYYHVPPKDQRYFGAGIKRQRVHFVPSSTSESNTHAGASTPSTLSASERYLQIVLNKATSEPPPSSESSAPRTCDVCKVQYQGDEAAHCSSLVHQIALPHSHPPSALDRNRKGLSMLQSYGWNPDERLGLGAQREGILHPVKAKEKRDTVGLGVNLNNDEPTLKKKRKTRDKPKPLERLDAGKIRKLEQNNKKKHDRLQSLFYSNDEVDKYLGAG
ncbi:unnamed protein product [Aureobasidium vineae]|uniref:G-patch domain-containing protein n=1 Tax=Aureobasidium vineae TaxID=2773715 RepID=A0A9N8JJF3_9PEZI|nr:unnamed protein product [Aureobasidium vineae]